MPNGWRNKEGLINKVVSDVGISKKQAKQALESLLDGIVTTVGEGGRVSLIGFGTFWSSSRKARIGRNPQTQAPLKIPARRVIKFTPSPQWKKAVEHRNAKMNKKR